MSAQSRHGNTGVILMDTHQCTKLKLNAIFLESGGGGTGYARIGSRACVHYRAGDLGAFSLGTGGLSRGRQVGVGFRRAGRAERVGGGSAAIQRAPTDELSGG